MLRQKQLPDKLPFAALTRGNDTRNRPRNTPNSLASNPQHAKKIILGLQFQNSVVYSPPNYWVILPGIIRNNIKTQIIIMKKIAIIALTAAAFVSCQQQQQQQVTPEVAPQIVVPTKK